MKEYPAAKGDAIMKKKRIIIICLIVLCVAAIAAALIHYFSYPERTKRALIDLGESQKFSQSEVEAAAQCVYDHFANSSDLYLKRLWYDEEESNRAVTSYMTTGSGAENVVDEANVIVLFTDYHTGMNYITGPNMDYEKFGWILVRDSETGEWRIVGSGLA